VPGAGGQSDRSRDGQLSMEQRCASRDGRERMHRREGARFWRFGACRCFGAAAAAAAAAASPSTGSPSLSSSSPLEPEMSERESHSAMAARADARRYRGAGGGRGGRSGSGAGASATAAVAPSIMCSSGCMGRNPNLEAERRGGSKETLRNTWTLRGRSPSLTGRRGQQPILAKSTVLGLGCTLLGTWALGLL
jgi:hypothetical protein